MNQFQTLVTLSIVEIFADFALKDYANTGNMYTGLIGATGYVVVVYLLVQSLRGSTILYVKGMWDGLSSLAESLAAFVFLGERFSRPEQYLGLFFTLIGLFLLKSKSDDRNIKGVSKIENLLSPLDRFS